MPNLRAVNLIVRSRSEGCKKGTRDQADLVLSTRTNSEVGLSLSLFVSLGRHARRRCWEGNRGIASPGTRSVSFGMEVGPACTGGAGGVGNGRVDGIPR